MGTALAEVVELGETESDATLAWDSLTCVVVQVDGDGQTGLGYTYGDESVARFVESKLVPEVEGADPLHPQAAWASMQEGIRNAGRSGVGAMAISGSTWRSGT